jgi:LPXTG-motif cell wall-anchored protein
MQKDFTITGSPGSLDVSIDNADGEESFFQRNKIPLLIGGAVLVAGGIYLATRKK